MYIFMYIKMCVYLYIYIYTFHSRQCRLFAAAPRVRGHAARMRQCRIRSVSVLTVYQFFGCRIVTMVAALQQCFAAALPHANSGIAACPLGHIARHCRITAALPLAALTVAVCYVRIRSHL